MDGSKLLDEDLLERGKKLHGLTSKGYGKLDADRTDRLTPLSAKKLKEESELEY